MDLETLIKKRRCVRQFSDKSVDIKLLKKILNIAKNAATGGNMQPWNVIVVRSKTKEKLSKKLLKAFDENYPFSGDYNYYPKEFFPPFDLRRHNSGTTIYHAANIEFSEAYADWNSVRKLMRANYNFFGADVGLFFCLDKRLTEGAFVDSGIFIQNIILLAEYFGLNTCPQAAFVNYTAVIKEALNIPKNMLLVCGMSLGYGEKNAPVNDYKMPKEALESFTTFYD